VQRLLIAGGATGGHLHPGVAVARCWTRAEGREVLFAGVRGRVEDRVLPRLGYAQRHVSASGLNGFGLRRRLAAVGRLPLGLLQGLGIVLSYRPDVVLSLGGFAAGPVCAAARLAGAPLVLLELNRRPGMTHRLLAPYAARIALSWSGTAACFHETPTVHTGTPVRWELQASRLDLEGPLRILVLGGSQGSREINALMVGAAPALAGHVAVEHLTGARDLERVRRAYRAAGLQARVEPFVDDMRGPYGRAHLAVCQAGASTCAELALVGLPALLVPFSRAAEDHQAENAAELARRGAAWVRRPAELTPARLARFILGLAADRAPLAERGRRARALASPGAAGAVVRVLEVEATRPHA
jgi:UDP-N-acetylglucosamine--N-acetylmuramyl-(pentapeptide) pyrophosphoryl-undecaprenol N-acetylglucosamine transferase